MVSSLPAVADVTAPTFNGPWPLIFGPSASAVTAAAARLTFGQGISDPRFIQITTRLFDAESGLESVSICAGTAVNASDIVPCTVVGQSSNIVIASASVQNVSARLVGKLWENALVIASAAVVDTLTHGDPIFFRVEATNHAGLSTTYVVPTRVHTIKPDASKATLRVVRTLAGKVSTLSDIILGLNEDLKASSRENVIETMVSGFRETGMPIVAYRYQVSAITALSSSVTIPVELLAAVPTNTTSFLAARYGAPAFYSPVAVSKAMCPPETVLCILTVTVTAIDSTGLEASVTDTAFLDPVLPTLSLVAVGSPARLQGTDGVVRWVEPRVWAKPNFVSAWWMGSDNHEVTYQWKVCPASAQAGSTAACFTDFLSVGNATRGTTVINGASLTTFKIIVRVTDPAGNFVEKESRVITIDTTSSLPGYIPMNALYIGSKSYPYANAGVRFLPWKYANGAIIKYEVAVGASANVPGFPWTDVTLDVQPTLSSDDSMYVPLPALTSTILSLDGVFVGIRGTSENGITTTVWSEGLTPDAVPAELQPGPVDRPATRSVGVNMALARWGIREGFMAAAPALVKPGLFFLREGPTSPVRNIITSTRPVSTIYVGWSGIVDQNALIESYVLSIGTAALQANVVPRTGFGSRTRDYTLNGVAFPHATLLFATLEVFSSSGARSVFTAQLLIDNEAPALAAIAVGAWSREGEQALIDSVDVAAVSEGAAEQFPAGFSPVMDAVYAYWHVRDAVKGANTDAANAMPLLYEAAVCQSTVLAVVSNTTLCPLNYTQNGISTNISLSGVKLNPSVRYTLFLRAKDNAGNTATFTSDPFGIDVTPPVVNGAALAVPAFLPSWKDIIPVISNATDKESGVSHIALCVRLAGSILDDVLPCINLPRDRDAPYNDAVALSRIGALTNSTAVDAYLAQVEGPIRVVVRAVVYNYAGLSSVVQSLPVTIDATLPTGGLFAVSSQWFTANGTNLLAIEAVSASDAIRATTSFTELAAVWPRWVNPGPSKLISFSYALGSAGCGSENLVSRRETNTTGVRLTNLSLRYGVQYVFSLWVINEAGTEVRVCADPVTVDTVAPRPGRVIETAGADSNIDVRYFGGETLYAKWTGFSDADSGIKEYQVRICRDKALNTNCLTAWYSVGLLTSVRLPALSITPGFTVYVQVRAIDHAGLFVDAFSNGVTYDPTAPVPGRVLRVAPDVISDWSQLRVIYEVFRDDESPITAYTLSVGLSDHGAELVERLVPGPMTGSFVLTRDDISAIQTNFATLVDMNSRGREIIPIFVTLSATNALGMSSSLGTVAYLDVFSPIAGSVEFLPVDFADTKALAASANGTNACNTTTEVLIASLTDVQVSGLVQSAQRRCGAVAPTFQVTTSAAAFKISGFSDPETAKIYRSLSFFYRVGSYPGGDDLLRETMYATPIFAEDSAMPPETIGGTGAIAVLVTNLNVLSGQSMYATVIAVDSAGLNATVTSARILVDATAPTNPSNTRPVDVLPAVVQAGVNASSNDTGLPTIGYGGFGTRAGVGVDPTKPTAAQDVDYLGDGSTYAFAFPGFMDIESGISHIEWSVIELTPEQNYNADRRPVGRTNVKAPNRNISSSEGAFDWAFYDTTPLIQNNTVVDGGFGGYSPAPTPLPSVNETALMEQALLDAMNNRTTTVTPALRRRAQAAPLPAHGAGAGPRYLVTRVQTRSLQEISLSPNGTATGETMFVPEPAYVAAADGELMPGSEWWGGKVLVPFTRTANTTTNVTVSGLTLQPGALIVAVVRVWNLAGSYNEAVTDGVLVDVGGVPCFGNIRVPGATVVAGASTAESQLYWSNATSLSLRIDQFADPYGTRNPGFASMRKLCPTVAGFFPEQFKRNLTYDTDLTYDLSLAPIVRYVAQIVEVDISGRGTVNSSVSNASLADPFASREARVPVSPLLYLGTEDQMPPSSPCCSEGYDAPARTNVDLTNAVAFTDVELRPVTPVEAFGASIAVAGSLPSAYTLQGSSQAAYAVIGGEGTGTVLPLHSRQGASLTVDFSSLLDVPATETIFAVGSEAVSGDVPPFAFSTSRGLFIFESHGDAVPSSTLEPVSKAGDKIYSVAAVGLTNANINPNSFDQTVVAMHGRGVALAGVSATNATNVLSVCNSAYFSASAEEMASMSHQYYWPAFACASVPTAKKAAAVALSKNILAATTTDGVVTVWTRNSTSAFSNIAEQVASGRVASARATTLRNTLDATFGSKLAAGEKVLAIARTSAAGRVAAYALADDGSLKMACYFEGPHATASLGVSLTVMSVAAAGSLASHLTDANRTLALIVAGYSSAMPDFPAGAYVLAVRAPLVNSSAPTCSVVTVVHMPVDSTLLADSIRTVVPSVAIGGNTILMADAEEKMWSDNDFDSEAGMGRVHAITFCGIHSVRTRSTSPMAILPYTCAACPAGQKSFGGLASQCSTCGSIDRASKCTVGNSTAALPASTFVSGATVYSASVSGLNLVHNKVYKAVVRGITESGRWIEAFSEEVRADFTAPLPGKVYEGVQRRVNGTSKDVCDTCFDDTDYTAVVDSISAAWTPATDPESGIARYLVGASSSPCDGIFHKTCEEVPVKLPELQNSPVRMVMPTSRKTCSNLELARRASLVSRSGIANAAAVLAGNVSMPFDGAFDVLPLTDVGLVTNATFSLTGRLTHGSMYYVCVVAESGSGLRTRVAGTGVVVDLTPPQIHYVADGFTLPDLSSQSFVDSVFASWNVTDEESLVDDVMWTHTQHPQGIQAALATHKAGGAVNWTTVVANINATFAWESVVWVNMAGRISDDATVAFSLQHKGTYYAVLRAFNGAGLRSPLAMSDGVIVGQAEVAPDPNRTVVAGFNPAKFLPDGSPANDSTSAAGEGHTLGQLELPSGAMPEGTMLKTGTVLGDDYGADVVDPKDTVMPANNLRFMDYSFRIQAFDENGQRISQFNFSKPIFISLNYNLNGTSGYKPGWEQDAAPKLMFFDLPSQSWMEARFSCPQPYENVDYEKNIVTTKVCHLTQFAGSVQDAPIAKLERIPEADVYVNRDAVSGLATPVTAELTWPNRNPPEVVLPYNEQPLSIILDASTSFDPDGNITSIEWSMGTPAAVPGRRLGATTAVALSSTTDLSTVATGLTAGTYSFSLTLRDNQDAVRVLSQTVVVNRRPNALISRPFYPVGIAFAAPTPLPETETKGLDSTAYTAALQWAQSDGNSVVVDGSASFDPDEGAAPLRPSRLLFRWSIDVFSADPRFPAGPVIETPNAPVSIIKNIGTGGARIKLTVTDPDGSSSVAVTAVGKPLIAVGSKLTIVQGVDTGPIRISAQDSVTMSSTASLSTTWTVTSVPSGASVSLPAPNNISTLVTGATVLGHYRFGLAMRDNALGVSSSSEATIIVHRKPVAAVVITPRGPATPSPATNGLPAAGTQIADLDASGSFDPDATLLGSTLVKYDWSYSFTPAPGTGASVVVSIDQLLAYSNNGAKAVFVGPVPSGRYSFTLVVEDSNGARSDPVTVSSFVGASGWAVSASPAATKTATATRTRSRTVTISASLTPSMTSSGTALPTSGKVTPSPSPVSNSPTATATQSASTSTSPSTSGSASVSASLSLSSSARPSVLTLPLTSRMPWIVPVVGAVGGLAVIALGVVATALFVGRRRQQHANKAATAGRKMVGPATPVLVMKQRPTIVGAAAAQSSMSNMGFGALNNPLRGGVFEKSIVPISGFGEVPMASASSAKTPGLRLFSPVGSASNMNAQSEAQQVPMQLASPMQMSSPMQAAGMPVQLRRVAPAASVASPANSTVPVPLPATLVIPSSPRITSQAFSPINGPTPTAMASGAAQTSSSFLNRMSLRSNPRFTPNMIRGANNNASAPVIVASPLYSRPSLRLADPASAIYGSQGTHQGM
jgi:hypothetical protein